MTATCSTAPSTRSCISIERKLSLYRGGYDQFDRQRRERQALQLKMKSKQEDQRRHMEAFVDRFRYKASKARQAQSRLKALARIEPIVAIADESVYPFRFPEPAKHFAPPIIAMEDVAVGYEPDRPVLSGLDLRIDDDDRIGLLGANGNGKSTFAKLIAGRLAPSAGKLRRPHRLDVAYFAQHQLDDLNPAHVGLRPCPRAAARRDRGAGPRPRRRPRVSRRRRWTRRRATFRAARKRGSCSGSPPSRAPHLLILDEPTNHLDIDSREALVQALTDYTGAVILISHDRHLLEASVDRLWLVADGTVMPFDGDMEDYRRLVLDSRAGTLRKNGGSGSSPAAARRREAADRREQSAPLRKKIKEIELLIAKLAERDSGDRPAARRADAL